MTNDQIKELAIANGFKLEEQPDGTMNLNPYVYEFASVVFSKGVVTVFDDILTDLEANENANTISSVIRSVKKHTENLSETNKKMLGKIAGKEELV
nr:hypothetical protein [Moraxella sp. CTOTU48717]